jgi:hypothetical protein
MPNQQQQVQIRAKDEDLKGDYSNMMMVTHTKEEFWLDFFFVSPPQGVLCSRIVMSPGHVKQVIKALEENIKKYEEKFGQIKEAEIPETKIGFDTK